LPYMAKQEPSGQVFVADGAGGLQPDGRLRFDEKGSVRLVALGSASAVPTDFFACLALPLVMGKFPNWAESAAPARHVPPICSWN
jgi:hypothetical protein